ncbi:MAG: hypothetical protein JWM47_1755 [Acidimicrobiales bacterium]|nr:hypothetical protein [Acidimicrobiales bacterium]
MANSSPASGPVDRSNTASMLGVPSDNTALLSLLGALADDGFDTSFSAVRNGRLRCGACGEEHPAASFEVFRLRRLEGASDPDDMQLVAAARCPACSARGVAVLGYGPNASEVDSDVVVALPDAPHAGT